MFASIYQQRRWLYIMLMVINLDFIYGGTDKCDDLPQPENTKVLSEQFPPFAIGTKLTFQCKSGYVDSGIKTTAECKEENNNTVWKIDSRCRAVSCGPPGEVTNGYRIGEIFTYSKNVTYKCHPGYKIKGVSVLFCGVNSQWTSTPPECKIVSCPRPQNIENGHASYSTLTYKSEVNYSCKKSFILNGPNKRRCQENETWSDSEPQCVEVTCPVPQKSHGGYFVPVKVAVDGKFSEDDVVIYYCNNSNKQSISSCKSGSWNSLPPVCDVDPTFTTITFKPPTTTEESSKKVDDVFTTESLKPKEITEGTTIKQELDCSAVPEIKHGSYTKESNNAITYNCDKGYRIKGSKTLTCLPSGKWDSNAPTCESGKLPIGYILGIVFGITALIAIIIGVSLYFIKRRKSQSPVKPSKASLNDAVNFEELQKLEKNHRPIPVTVL